MKFLCGGSLILFFSTVQTTNLRSGSINFSSACHAVSWLQYGVCLPYGCRRLPLTLALCFDSVLHVLWTPGCDVNLNGETVKVPLSGWEWFKVTEILFNSVAGHSFFNQALNYTQTRTKPPPPLPGVIHCDAFRPPWLSDQNADPLMFTSLWQSVFQSWKHKQEQNIRKTCWRSQFKKHHHSVSLCAGSVCPVINLSIYLSIDLSE